ncbi:MAG: chloride channel protein [Phycisphaerae bacterium]|nr:chloride channel protein [Phycisphaerae bacterium]
MTPPPATPPTSLRQRLRGVLVGLGGASLATATVVGIVMGLAALAFIHPIHWAEKTLGREVAGHVPWVGLAILVTAPMIGGLLTGILRWLVPLKIGGHGVTQVLYAIHRDGARLPPAIGIRQWLGSTFTIGSGGSAGPEGPIVAIGSVVGSSMGRLLRTDAESTRTLLGCGAAAGFAAVFNAPIAGIFFVLEVLLRDFSLRLFTPIVVAAVVSGATAQTILGSNQPLFGVGPETFGGDAFAFTLEQIPMFLLLGTTCGVGAVAAMRSLVIAEKGLGRVFGAARIPGLLHPAMGGLLLGATGGAFWWMTRGGAWPIESLPPFLGTGYDMIREVVSGEFFRLHQSDAAAVLAILLVLKMLGIGFTLGSGGAGGFFAPAMFLGAALGGLFGLLAAELAWLPGASPAVCALVGMAAMVAATTHAPMTGVLLVYELTRDYDFILPLMLVAAIATSLSRRVAGESLYTAELAALGVRLGRSGDHAILRRSKVGDLPLRAAVTLHATDRGPRLVELAEKHPVSDFVVVDSEDRFLGLVPGDLLRDALVYRESLPLLQVSEMMRPGLPTLDAHDTLDVAVEKFARADCESLPVLDEDGRVLGMATRTRMLRHYHAKLEQD